MLEWLKAILGEAYSEETDKKVSEEIGKNFVARADFNTLSAEKKTLADTVKERDKQLEALKATTPNREDRRNENRAVRQPIRERTDVVWILPHEYLSNQLWGMERQHNEKDTVREYRYAGQPPGG